MTAEYLIFVSHRVTDFDPPVPGSTTATCHDCGAEIWVAPSSRAALRKASKVVCSRCMPPDEIPLDQVVERAPEVDAEIDAYLGPAGKVTCRLCGERVPDRIFIMREHLLGHRPEAVSLPVWRIQEEFRKAGG